MGLVTVEAELAALVYDSRGAELALARSEEAQARIVTFANDHLTVDLELLADGRTIVGELQPAEAATVELETVGQGRVTTVADEYGRFRLTSDATSLRIRVVGPPRHPWDHAAETATAPSLVGRSPAVALDLAPAPLPVQPLGHGGPAGAGGTAGWLRGPGGGVEPGGQALPRQLPVAPLRPGVGGARRHHRAQPARDARPDSVGQPGGGHVEGGGDGGVAGVGVLTAGAARPGGGPRHGGRVHPPAVR